MPAPLHRSGTADGLSFRASSGRFQQRHIYHDVQAHWSAWFPHLPSYQAFNSRLNLLSPCLALLLEELLAQLRSQPLTTSDLVLDSLPIILAKASRADAAKIAKEIANKGYCATKKLYYHGVKLHLLGQRRSGRLPLPWELALTPASVQDLTAFRQAFEVAGGGVIFADKAYKDETTKAECRERQVEMCTPDKSAKRGRKSSGVCQSVVPFCFGDAAAHRVVVQLADSKIRNPGGKSSALNQWFASALLWQTHGLLLATPLQLLIRILSFSLRTPYSSV